jgi:Raf kinase inhibitor-like YbhB/YbcL family protein
MSLMGTLLKNRRAGESALAWNQQALAGPDTLEVSSPAFADGTAMGREYAGKLVGGRELSPPLAWSAAPAGTAELLLVVEDIDAPMRKPVVHCLALVPPTFSDLPAGALNAPANTEGVRLLRSTMKRGYMGPAPIKGHGPHRYVFQVFALGASATASGATLASARPRALLRALHGPVLARGRFTGTYER